MRIFKEQIIVFFTPTLFCIILKTLPSLVLSHGYTEESNYLQRNSGSQPLLRRRSHENETSSFKDILFLPWLKVALVKFGDRNIVILWQYLFYINYLTFGDINRGLKNLNFKISRKVNLMDSRNGR